MIAGIDASNLRDGGGVTHLVSLLAAAHPQEHGFETVRVWGPGATLARLEEREWLEPVRVAALERSLPWRQKWQHLTLPTLARSCDVLFSPGGTIPHRVSPVVTMSRNMLPFEWRELRRYGLSYIGCRLVLLRRAQSSAFRRADGVIFLTRYAEENVSRVTAVPGLRAVIPHGVDSRFLAAPRPQHPIDAYSRARPLRLLYVSIVDVYKHQWQVARAAAELRRAGLPVAATFVGPAYPPALARLRRVLADEDPAGEFLRYVGPVPHANLPQTYAEADLAVFASSCENMPNILLEAMASGLPIACSERGPMPEVLGDGGTYFDPESPSSIAAAIRRLAENPELRARLASAARARAQEYTWRRCADSTFSFLAKVCTSTGPGPR